MGTRQVDLSLPVSRSRQLESLPLITCQGQRFRFANCLAGKLRVRVADSQGVAAIPLPPGV